MKYIIIIPALLFCFQNAEAQINFPLDEQPLTGNCTIEVSTLLQVRDQEPIYNPFVTSKEEKERCVHSAVSYAIHEELAALFLSLVVPTQDSSKPLFVIVEQSEETKAQQLAFITRIANDECACQCDSLPPSKIWDDYPSDEPSSLDEYDQKMVERILDEVAAQTVEESKQPKKRRKKAKEKQ